MLIRNYVITEYLKVFSIKENNCFKFVFDIALHLHSFYLSKTQFLSFLHS